MEVVTGATGSVLTKVGTLLQEEYFRQKGVKKDVESLQKELFFMRAALYKVAEVPPEQLDEQVKAWASNVKALSYDMEDAVDTFNVRVTASKDHAPEGTTGMRIPGIGKVRRYHARSKLAGVIAEMKDLTMQVAELRDRYKLDDIHVTNTKEQVQEVKDIISRNLQLWTWWRQRMSFRIQEVWEGWRSRGIGFILAANSSPDILPPCLINRVNGFLGTHDDMRKLTEWVCNVSKGGVLYIIGDVGVGKTTMAMDLYHKCCHLFAGRAIIKMTSRPSDGKMITDGLDSEATRKKIEAIEDIWQESRHLVLNYGVGAEETLKKINVIKDRLLKSRHLVLIDGVDSEETWKEIKDYLFPILEGKREVEDGILHAGSKIIVTTRLPGVASPHPEEDLMHRLALGDKEAKHIFMAALRESTRGGDMIKHCHIPARVWEMCVGHRMAVIVMAGYAACNPHMLPDEWKRVCNKLLPDSVKALTRNGVSRILSHCYHDMSAEIKTCSLYLSMYPKGSRVRRKHLARRWMAEGFVVNKPGKSMEQVADDYFDQLVRRNMVRPVQRSNTGKVKVCEVDDLVHDFIVSKASEENLVTVHKQGLPPAPPSASCRVRRLSFSVDKPDANAPVGQKMNVGLSMSHVRSLALFGPEGEESGSKEDVRSLLRDSPIIQVLDLEGWQSVRVTRKDMEEICNMFLLKYLSLRGTMTVMKKLIGSDIDRLRNLETLDVRETEIAELPDTIWKLQRLVNIFGGDKKKRKAFKLQPPQPTSRTQTPSKNTLRVISGIEFTRGLAEHLNKETNLMKLAIYKADTESKKSMLQLLECRGCLQSLVVMDDVDDLSDSLSADIESFKSLAALDISGKLKKVPEWIKQLEALTQLTLPVTVFQADQLVLKDLAGLNKLISLAFSESPKSLLSPVKKEIIVPTGGFDHLKLLQFIAKTMPPMSFLDNAMPSLAQIHLRFTTFEGLHGIHNLHKLQEVHIHVDIGESQEFTKSMLGNLVEAAREHANGTRIVHHCICVNTPYLITSAA